MADERSDDKHGERWEFTTGVEVVFSVTPEGVVRFNDAGELRDTGVRVPSPNCTLLDIARALARALAAPSAASSAVSEETICPGCKGSGDMKGMTQGLGPDDYEVDVECSKCGGTGVIAPSSAVPLVEKIEELQRAVPPEEWDKLPRSSERRPNQDGGYCKGIEGHWTGPLGGQVSWVCTDPKCPDHAAASHEVTREQMDQAWNAEDMPLLKDGITDAEMWGTINQLVRAAFDRGFLAARKRSCGKEVVSRKFPGVDIDAVHGGRMPKTEPTADAKLWLIFFEDADRRPEIPL